MEKKTKEVSFIKKFKFLLKSSREYKKYSYLSILFVFMETIFECIIPYVMMLLINLMGELVGGNLTETVKSTALNTVLIYGGILLALAMCSLACGILSGKMCAIASCGFTRNLRGDLFKKITTFSFSNIDKFSASSLITRQTTDIYEIQMAYMMVIRIAIRAPFMFIFSFIMAIVVAPQLSWTFAITIPFIAIILGCIIPIATKRFTVLFDQYDELNEITEENIRGIRVVKTYAREDHEKEKFYNHSLKMSKGFQVIERLLSATNPAMQAVMYISNSLILLLGTLAVIGLAKLENGVIVWGSFTIGSISSLITYSAQVLSSILMVSMVLFMILMAVPAIKRCYEVLVEEPTIKNPENAVTTIENGDIEFNNVSFKYKADAEKFALSNVNLKIKSGETIGIIGSTGSSKSTLVNLISRFYDTTEGEVKVAGRNVKEYDLKTLRDNVSMVLQKNVLFSGTINENLRWGNKDATEEEILRASKIAQADPFVQTFPDKYETHIDQGGVNVSGGQRQRLCIARALLKNPKVLILDDSTSAVDTKTDAYIRKGLREYCPDLTKIIIAQRLSSVEDADKIIVLDNGEINGIGTHEELLKNNEIYKEIYEIQNKIGGAH